MNPPVVFGGPWDEDEDHPGCGSRTEAADIVEAFVKRDAQRLVSRVGAAAAVGLAAGAASWARHRDRTP